MSNLLADITVIGDKIKINKKDEVHYLNIHGISEVALVASKIDVVVATDTDKIYMGLETKQNAKEVFEYICSKVDNELKKNSNEDKL